MSLNHKLVRKLTATTSQPTATSKSAIINQPVTINQSLAISQPVAVNQSPAISQPVTINQSPAVNHPVAVNQSPAVNQLTPTSHLMAHNVSATDNVVSRTTYICTEHCGIMRVNSQEPL